MKLKHPMQYNAMHAWFIRLDKIRTMIEVSKKFNFLMGTEYKLVYGWVEKPQ